MSEETEVSVSEEIVQAPADAATAVGEQGVVQGEADTTQVAAKEGEPSESGSGETGVGEDGTPKAPAFKARDKFKVLDSEHEVPPWLKGIIKDETSEKQVIELLEKAYGLDPVKTKLQDARKERDAVKTEFTNLQRGVEDLKQTYQRGDIDSFFKKLAIPENNILEWAVEKLQYSQLTPEQKRMYDEHIQAKRQAWQYQDQAMSVEQRFVEQARQAKSMLLEASLARPEVSTFEQSFDAMFGKTGAFREEIVATGELEWVKSGQKVDLSPQQAIERVMQKWRPILEKGAQKATPTPEQSTQATPKAAPSVIPNVQGRAQSPLASKPRSVDELRKISNQMSAS